MPNGSSSQAGIYNGNYKHGGKGTKLYAIWCAMKDRCNRITHPHYADYGGRGISVCDEWQNDYKAFEIWAFNNGYSDGLSIDRIDNNGNYCPENCRWADRKQQANNKRTTLNILYNGETKTLSEWAEILNINQSTLYYRIYKLGWSVERAFEEVVSLDKHHRKKKCDTVQN